MFLAGNRLRANQVTVEVEVAAHAGRAPESAATPPAAVAAATTAGWRVRHNQMPPPTIEASATNWALTRPKTTGGLRLMNSTKNRASPEPMR
jgi:hypothetical protein